MKKINEKQWRKFILEAGLGLDWVLQKHTTDRLKEGNIIQGDILYLLQNFDKFSYQKKATLGHHKYKLYGITPNSGQREICVVVIPGEIEGRKGVKIITVMWKDK